MINIQQPNGNYRYIVDVNNGISVFINGEPRFVPATNKNFQMLLKAIEKDDANAIEVLSRPPVQRVKRLLAETQGELKVEDGEVVDKNGNSVTSTVTQYIGKMVETGASPKPLLRLMERIRNNPSATAQKELPLWIEQAKMAITPEGKILAYKKVNKDFTSIHDGKTRNDVGTFVEMPRGAVDDDSSRTCSHGLHFCSADYLEHFGSNNPEDMRIILLEVDPADVVSIPKDYNNAKGRACRYKVLKDVTDDFSELVERLAKEATYSVVIDDDYNDVESYSWENDEEDEVEREYERDSSLEDLRSIGNVQDFLIKVFGARYN